MKILINTPPITSPAGVSSHYLGLRPYFSKNVIYNQYITGNFLKRKLKLHFLYKPARFLALGYDIIKFIFLVLIHKRPIILLNPSFGKDALKRDVLFLSIAKFLGCKVAVFLHGWDKGYLTTVLNGEDHFSTAWGKADAFFVLAKEFKEYLQRLGIEAPIHLTTTKVNDKLLEGLPENRRIDRIQNILFLARVEKAKGIFTTIDIFKLLQEKYSDLKLRVVGGGNMLSRAKTYVSDMGLNNVTFTGPLHGTDLKNEFLAADLYILPTTHGEGMPTSVLEAMAFGLPVITRPVGGLIDFFENDRMGYMLEGLEPEDYVAQIERLIKNVDKANEISSYNKQYAKEHFMATKVAKHLEGILDRLK